MVMMSRILPADSSRRSSLRACIWNMSHASRFWMQKSQSHVGLNLCGSGISHPPELTRPWVTLIHGAGLAGQGAIQLPCQPVAHALAPGVDRVRALDVLPAHRMVAPGSSGTASMVTMYFLPGSK